MARPFLTARWSNLVNLTYAVSPELLEEHVPDGLELDVQDEKAFVSLVAFDFLDTRVMGIGWPGFRNFPELNLRFYVKRGPHRGVVFLREYVPQRIVASIANRLYNESYVAAPMDSRFQDHDGLVSYELSVEYGGRNHHVRITASEPTFRPSEDTRAHYFKEHRWGFGRDHDGSTLCYEVVHPIWDIWTVQSWSTEVDFRILYGDEWAFLVDQAPAEVLFAVGSKIQVHPKRTLADVDLAAPPAGVIHS